jgi:ribosome-binding factor A
MAKKRIARVNEQIRRELTYLLQRDVRDPRIGIVTVTAVETSPDLYHAKVFYSVMGSDEDRASAAEGLRAAAGFLRTEIGRRMHIRRAPELHFSYDDTLQHAMHIERLLQEAMAVSGTSSPADRTNAIDTDDATASNANDAADADTPAADSDAADSDAADSDADTDADTDAAAADAPADADRTDHTGVHGEHGRS